MSPAKDLSGVHVALTTPFDRETGAVDHDALERHASWLLDHGIDGRVPNGPLGEVESLDQDERREVIRTVARATAGRAKLVVGIAAPNYRVACAQARHASTLGASGVLLLPPTNHAPTSAELLDHYRSVAQEGLPVVIDNDPSAARIDLTPEIIDELAQLEGIAAVKESSGDVRRLSEIAERTPHLQLLCGTDDLALESALMGATGWIGGFAGALPSETVRLFQLGRLGEVVGAQPLYRAMLPLLRWGSRARAVGAIKSALDHLGLSAGGPPRPPRRVVDDIEREIIAGQDDRARAAP